MSEIDQLLAANQNFSQGYDPSGAGAPPRRKVAIVACMDARVDVWRALGLREGDAHVIRNAGGAITPDAIRSLAVSQRKLGTEEILLIHHTGCGMQGLGEDAFRAELERETGIRPDWPVEGFDDVEADVRQSIGRIIASPFIPRKDRVRGFVYELETGLLKEVTPA